MNRETKGGGSDLLIGYAFQEEPPDVCNECEEPALNN
jgi:hypothetical protein